MSASTLGRQPKNWGERAGRVTHLELADEARRTYRMTVQGSDQWG